MTESSHSEEAIFGRAADLPAAERASYLQQTCGGDIALRARVEELLRAHDEAGNLLEAAPGSAVRSALFRLSREEKPGTVIGRYKLLQKIGEGGCGVVFMAEQEEPIRRRVALKVIKLGLDTRDVIARFEAERQALAMMDHANIAKVLDAGATENGRPYFVMELVRGAKITDYCDQQKLSTAQRLNLFIQVCHAIQHAHQKGIIHRDIKPSNILVTLQDGEPLPKVIDFGIAKATQGRLTDQTLFTAFEQFVGTPAYMSPEQAQMSSEDVDTRSDVYSLGVLLYELLTGRTPFESKALLKAGLDEMRRQIRDVEPPKPSTRLRTLDPAALTTAAQHRATESPRLVHLVRGDLDWIVMRCLEKSRARRYPTTDELARDLEKHLRDEPVSARPPSALYRFQKLARRNRLVVAATGAIAAALVIGLGVSLWMYSRERTARERAVAAEEQQSRLRADAEEARSDEARQREQAEADRKKAETEAAKSQQVAQFLKKMLSGVGPRAALGRDTTLLREILDKTVERMGQDLREQPEVEAELQLVIGGVYLDLGKPSKAEDMIKASLATRRRLFGIESLPSADALYLLGVTVGVLSRPDEAKEIFSECLAIRRKLLGEENLDVANALSGLAGVRTRVDFAAIEKLTREALAIRRKLRGPIHPDVANSLQGLGRCLIQRGEFRQGKALLREAVAILRQTLGDEHPDTARAIHLLANFQMQHGDYAAAEPLLREAYERNRRLLGDEHWETDFAQFQFGHALELTSHSTEAVAMMRDAILGARRTFGSEHALLSDMLAIYGIVLQKRGEREEGQAAVREALEIRNSAQLGNSSIWLGWRFYEAGLFQGAESIFQEEAESARKLPGDGGVAVATALNGLGWTCFKEGRYGDAESAFSERLRIQRQLSSADDSAIAETLQALGTVLVATGDEARAEALFREAMAIERKLPDAYIDITAGSYAALAEIAFHRGNFPEAEALLSEAFGIAEKNDEIETEGGIRIVEGLADLYATWAQTDPDKVVRATEWTHRLAKLKNAAPETRQPDSPAASGNH